MCSFNSFVLFSAVFLVVLVIFFGMFVPMLVASRRNTVRELWRRRDARTRVEDSKQLLSGFKASIFIDRALS